MTWDEQCQQEIDKTLAAVAHREVLYTTITKLIDAKIHQAFYHAGLGGSSYDPNEVVDYQERLLAAVIDELHKDRAQ
jgi:choline kinase